MSITIIVGAPCAGKTTWAQANKTDTTIIVDYDQLALALGSDKPREIDEPYAAITYSAWKTIVDELLTTSETSETSAYIIHSKPSETQISAYENAGANFTLIDPGLETCLTRAREQGLTDRTEDFIRDWYEHPPILPDSTTVITSESPPEDTTDDDTSIQEDSKPTDKAKSVGFMIGGKMLTKTIPAQVKAVGGVTSDHHINFEGYASVFENQDLSGDIVKKGAFARTLEERYPDGGAGIPVYWNHDVNDPFKNLGTTTKAYEDEHGLKVEGTIDTSTSLGQQVANLLKAGRVAQMSFAYNVCDGQWVEPLDLKEYGHFEITDVDLFEVSICPIGCNQETEVSAKTAMPDPHAKTAIETPVKLEQPLQACQNEPTPHLDREAKSCSQNQTIQEKEGNPMDLEKLINDEAKAAEAISLKALEENRAMTAEEKQAFDTHIDTAEKLKKLNNSTKNVPVPVSEGSVKIDEKSDAIDTTPISQRFMQGASYKAYHDQVERFASDPAELHIAKTHIGSLNEFLAAKKDGGSAITTALAHSQAERLPMVDTVARPAVTLLDVISRGTISSESAEYLQVVKVTRNTGIVPENTGNPDTDTIKPQSNFDTNLETAKVYQYADGYSVTTQMMRDSAMLASFLDNEFKYSFDLKIADMLLNGSGTNGQPRGLLNTTGVQKAEYSRIGDEAKNLILAIRRALTKLTHVGSSANAILINPADAEKIDLLQDTQGRFLGNGPWASGPSTVWSRPLVESEQVDEGKIIVGDFHQIALLDRTGLNVEAFYQHDNYAARNLVYVRAELAAAQAIWRPLDFVVLEGKTSEASSSPAPKKTAETK